MRFMFSNSVSLIAILLPLFHPRPDTPNGPFPSGVQIKIVYVFLLFISSPTQLILLDFNTIIILMRSVKYEAPHHGTSSNILLFSRTLFSVLS
jgi:hypothetical protein